MRQWLKRELKGYVVVFFALVGALYLGVSALRLLAPDAEAQTLGGIVTGRATCATTATQFTSQRVRSVCFKNPGSTTVYVGGSDVTATTDFVQLATGESWCPSDIGNVSVVRCITSTGTQVLPYVGAQ